MVKNYPHIFFLVLLAFPTTSFTQEIRIFTVSDFDLKDSVKTCLVSTKYGKEEYDFNQRGLLTKTVTRYNESDYDVVYYKYQDSLLVEKRSETYRDNKFDPGTSIAHFFKLDTIGQTKITENIISYDKEFLDQYIYTYDDKGDLTKIVRTNDEGTDETQVEYKKDKGEYTITYLLNDVPLKSIRTSFQTKNGEKQKIVLTKEFLKGEATKAYEEVFGPNGKLLAQQEFEYDLETKKFVPTVRTTFEYDTNGMLVQEIKRGETILDKKEYIYQYDREGEGNWVKQIVTPENTYTTRKITYYE
ncbi:MULTISPECIES: hypothetical protein [Maribacter]|uniref:RHS repeat protein n=1 Tax=Maribacter flavus TaxID=1658664 RepID=A0ABU7IJ52_9FLAO|nr:MULTISPECIES: hypothetical protein [Maribacter]MDC6405750.1 hypothetical protein [Maribacter sp. PR66]MEE1972998.1 hypothetical protein [Maribacter flavus]